jgi:hypothetical protein
MRGLRAMIAGAESVSTRQVLGSRPTTGNARGRTRVTTGGEAVGIGGATGHRRFCLECPSAVRRRVVSFKPAHVVSVLYAERTAFLPVIQGLTKDANLFPSRALAASVMA